MSLARRWRHSKAIILPGQGMAARMERPIQRLDRRWRIKLWVNFFVVILGPMAVLVGSVWLIGWLMKQR